MAGSESEATQVIDLPSENDRQGHLTRPAEPTVPILKTFHRPGTAIHQLCKKMWQFPVVICIHTYGKLCIKPAQFALVVLQVVGSVCDRPICTYQYTNKHIRILSIIIIYTYCTYLMVFVHELHAYTYTAYRDSHPNGMYFGRTNLRGYSGSGVGGGFACEWRFLVNRL